MHPWSNRRVDAYEDLRDSPSKLGNKDIYSHESVISRQKLVSDLKRKRSAVKRKFTNTYKKLSMHIDFDNLPTNVDSDVLTTTARSRNKHHKKTKSNVDRRFASTNMSFQREEILSVNSSH